MALPPDPLILPADQAGLVDLLAAAARAYAGDSAEERGAWFDAMIMLDWAPALSLLLNLVDHADPGIRREVASHLPWADRDADADSASVAALVLLTHDPVALVRDWAATGLGFLDDADSPAVREALRRLLDEPDSADAYPAAEAAYALATFGDADVVPVIAARLDDEVGMLWLTAAEASGDARLLPALIALTAPDEDLTDPWVQQLHDAIESCSGA